MLKNKKGLFIVLAIIIIVAIVAWKYFSAPTTPQGLAFSNGRLEATETAVATKVQGKLIAVFFREGDDLKAGEVAAQLDDEEIKAEVLAAEAAVQQSKEAAKVARDDVITYQAQLKLAQVTLKRSQALIKTHAISAQELDRDLSTYQSARGNLSAAKNRVLLSDANIKESEARLESAKSKLNDLTLVSPVDSRILYRLAEPGEYLPAGGRVFSLLDLFDIYMYIYLSSNDAGSVAIGSEARIVLDAIPDHPIPGKVVYVAPRNQFTPKEVETKDEREKFMFRIKIRVDKDWIAKYGNMAKPGMPGTGWVKTDPNATWPDNLQVK